YTYETPSSPSNPTPQRVVSVPSQPGAAPRPGSPAPNPTRDDIIARSQAGDIEGARQILEQALAADPNNPELLGLRALTEERQDTKLTSSRLKDIVSPFLGAAPDPGALADGESPGQTPISAAAAIPIGLSVGRGPPIPREQIAAPPRADKNSPAVRAALDALKIKDYSRAEARLAEHLDGNPGDWYARSLRALALRQQGRYREAARQAQTAVRLNPFDPEAHKITGLIFSDLRDYEASAEEYGKAQSINPDDAAARAGRGKAFMNLGRTEEGLDDLQAAAKLDPSLAYLYDEAVRSKSPVSGRRARSHAAALVGAVLGLALLVAALQLWTYKSGKTGLSRRPAMRRADRGEAPCAGYEIVRQIGEGGMGTVFEALDTALQRRVALKRLRAEIAADARERRRFLKEARTVASLKHPHIIEIYSVVEQGDGLFLVFELLEGRTLDEVLRERRALTPAEALALARPVALALDHAHAQGVIHQDLKPGNVMVTAKTVKVMDFGIARRVLETLSTIGAAEVVGTPAYMAPEQEQGACSPASDVYALGVCLYEMLGGKRPFDGAGSYLRKMQRQYQPLRSISPGLCAGIEAVVDKALDPAPEKRHASAALLVADLERWLMAGTTV
ncbi:MAG: protein kinase, partial [Elusimicrobia bacterium]|nr:protein kinase [Elusimicrobiota bacterium]